MDRQAGFSGKARAVVLAALLTCLLLPSFSSPAFASGRWIPATEELQEEAWLVREEAFTGEIRMTFLGDCTLGGEEKQQGSRLSFAGRIAENGMSFPFRELQKLTADDDLTVANLECVLSDRKLEKVEKEYNFIGPTDYTQILTEADIDCVTVANNHSHDYGEKGYADTKKALESAGVAWFGTDRAAVWRSDEGILIGFLGVSHSLAGSRYKQYAAQAEQLKQLGCAAIITVMHAGTEYSYEAPDSYQRQIAERAAESGSCLVVGHHPHVVQGYDILSGVPVVWSLGNCSFGGTTHAKDSDALVLQAVLAFEEDRLTRIDLHFYPISITSDERYNNYSPRFLDGEDAKRVLDKMKKSTGTDPGLWTEEQGAVVSVSR